MKRLVRENVDWINGREYLAVEVHLGPEDDAAEGCEIWLERVVVVVVELGGLGKES